MYPCVFQTPVLPPTITDQIRLWELERDRLQFTEGVLYNQFLSQADFEVLRDRAQSILSQMLTVQHTQSPRS
ncbi:General transcription factor IIH subunit 4 [Ilyodon furcidens]|uniref:General transcription factor IIH subunit 4 n=1 Tax=Ilyodon furcidens TaxID=33524 RepID=A0ABV0SR56_9TELE